MADSTRAALVVFAATMRKSTQLPNGFNAVVVVTDAEGEWVGVSSTADDSYTAKLLQSALNGAELRRHQACENCGNGEGVQLVTYDAMVDGPGYEISEYRCAECRGEQSGR